jgi:hypothetical protein
MKKKEKLKNIINGKIIDSNLLDPNFNLSINKQILIKNITSKNDTNPVIEITKLTLQGNGYYTCDTIATCDVTNAVGKCGLTMMTCPYGGTGFVCDILMTRENS